jgi:hypothetical protein
VLRITQLPDATGVCLKVEGRLAGEWVSLLEAELERAAGSVLSLDLAAVDFASPAAIEMLQGVTARGVRIVACSLFLSNQLVVSAP